MKPNFDKMADQFCETFRNNIVAVRKYKQMTMTECANAVGIPLPRWSEMERNKFAPSYKTIARAAIALKVEPWELLDPETAKRCQS
jgi:transcriptional regulator with XRE-family HTH domain